MKKDMYTTKKHTVTKIEKDVKVRVLVNTSVYNKETYDCENTKVRVLQKYRSMRNKKKGLEKWKTESNPQMEKRKI